MSQVLFGMDGKVALVTGASGGLGRHFAKVLARAGAVVVVTARPNDNLADLVGEIEAAGGAAQVVSMDVSDADSVAVAFDQITERGFVPDVVINNAGLTVTKPLLSHTGADWDRVLDTNLKGSWLVATEAARRMIKAGRSGAIVNIASILGERVAGGVAPYAGNSDFILVAQHIVNVIAGGRHQRLVVIGFAGGRGRDHPQTRSVLAGQKTGARG